MNAFKCVLKFLQVKHIGIGIVSEIGLTARAVKSEVRI